MKAASILALAGRCFPCVQPVLVGAIAIVMSIAQTGSVRAQDSADLAKQLANPIANLISVPFQFNYDQGYGPLDGDQYLLNVQPVIPFSLNEDWNLITRTIVPIKQTHDIAGPSGTQFGLGDTTASAWFSPKAPTAGGLIWGVGPIAYLPTSTDDLLGAGVWGGGPTAIALVQQGPWTYGALTNQVWSFEDDSINSLFLQPFLTYNTPSAWTFAINSESTHNWNTGEWSVPVNLQVSKLVNFGNQPVQFTVGVGKYLESFTGGADGWRGRFAVTFLFPKR